MSQSPIRSYLSRRDALCGALAAGLASARPIVVSSKIDTEGALLGSLIARVLRLRGLPVSERLQLGPTSIVRQALLSGAIDIYPEYTGDAAVFFHKEGDPAWHNPDAAWALAKRLDAANGIVWLSPAPASNGWGMAVTRAAARQGLRSLADLPTWLRGGAPFLLAASVEFAESPDALPAFERAYGFRLDQNQMILLAGGNTAATLRAAAEGISGVNAAMAYTTDGALDVLGLYLLTDPRHAQIVFQPAPVIRAPVLAAHPEIAGWLAPAFAGLTESVLRHLNAAVVRGARPRDVASRYLEGAA